jgi:hypothetical protein
MAVHHLRVIEGGGGDDLVAAILRALDLAKTSKSPTTIYLLKMALLNEGTLIAADLSKEQAAVAAKEGHPRKI